MSGEANPFITIRPKDLQVGDVFEEPESEEEHHGRRKAVREVYEVLELQYRGREPALMTIAFTIRRSDSEIIEVRMVPWVWLKVKRLSPNEAASYDPRRRIAETQSRRRQ